MLPIMGASSGRAAADETGRASRPAGRPVTADPVSVPRNTGVSRLPGRLPDPAGQAAGLHALLAIAVPVLPSHDMTWPLSSYREDRTGALPLYRQAVASAGWDPVASAGLDCSAASAYRDRVPE
jgi:hypothetical protein